MSERITPSRLLSIPCTVQAPKDRPDCPLGRLSERLRIVTFHSPPKDVSRYCVIDSASGEILAQGVDLLQLRDRIQEVASDHTADYEDAAAELGLDPSYPPAKYEDLAHTILDAIQGDRVAEILQAAETIVRSCVAPIMKKGGS